jgi:hypothetical protein
MEHEMGMEALSALSEKSMGVLRAAGDNSRNRTAFRKLGVDGWPWDFRSYR